MFAVTPFCEGRPARALPKIRQAVRARSGAIATIPRVLIPVVGEADPRCCEELELSPLGSTLRFPSLDADFAVQGLIRRVFGVNEANRVAGATKTKARAAVTSQRRKGRSTAHAPMSKESSHPQSAVFIVDDDDALRAEVGRLVRSIGLNAVLLASAREFLAQKLPDAPCCLVLDVRLPGLGGLDFQAELAKANVRTPIIFLTAYGDIPIDREGGEGGSS